MEGGSCRYAPSSDDLEGEVDENGDGHVLLEQTLLEELERCDRVIGHETDFSEEVKDDERLDVCGGRAQDSAINAKVGRVEKKAIGGRTLELDNAPHDRVDLLDVHVGVVLGDRVLQEEERRPKVNRVKGRTKQKEKDVYLVLVLEQPGRDEHVYDAPEVQVASEGNERCVERRRAEVFIAELDRVEGEEDLRGKTPKSDRARRVHKIERD